jgi:Lrp/AsnC family leucine-responsive transcriptional regulator
MSTEILDETDLRILRAMQEDCRLTTKELAQKIHLSNTPTFERQRRLERMGYIQKYVAVLDAEKLERGFIVFCNISMKQINQSVTTAFQQALEQWNEVSECYNVSGDCDFMMKVYVSSMKQYQEFVLNKVGALDFVARIQSVFVMDTLKLNYGIPI